MSAWRAGPIRGIKKENGENGNVKPYLAKRGFKGTYSYFHYLSADRGMGHQAKKDVLDRFKIK